MFVSFFDIVLVVRGTDMSENLSFYLSIYLSMYFSILFHLFVHVLILIYRDLIYVSDVRFCHRLTKCNDTSRGHTTHCIFELVECHMSNIL